jgi:hypothetical protein
LNLIKQIKAANEQMNIFEPEANNEHFSTKDGPRYSDDMRTCIMDLHGSDIPGNKISNVINVVRKNIHLFICSFYLFYKIQIFILFIFHFYTFIVQFLF